jgi:hypothetical protein
MALVNTSTMARCSASQSSAVASSRLSQSAKASRAVVRLGRALGSDRCSGGTASASRWAASAVMSSLWPVRVSISTLSWQTRSAAAWCGADESGAGDGPAADGPAADRPAADRPVAVLAAAASAATTASSAMPSAMVRSGRSTRPSLYSRISSPGASVLLASVGVEPVPSGPVPVPLRYLAFPSKLMTSGGGCPHVA